MQRLGTTYKLTLLLALLSTAPLVFLVFNRSTQEIQSKTSQRLAACEQLAMTCSLHLQDKNYSAIRQLLDHFIQRSDGLGSVRIVRYDGLVIHQIGDHAMRWNGNASSDANNIRIPLSRGGKAWGDLEASFVEDFARAQLHTLFYAFAATLSLNLLTFGLLLKRSLSVLDSGNAVPRRVKNTLDTIVGGVVIMDPNGRIVMANEAFQASSGKKIEDLIGHELCSIPFRSLEKELPWEIAAANRERQSGATLYLEDTEGAERCFVVNATPIFDSKDQLAGTLISFEDITKLEEQKQSLVKALEELEASKEKIQQQNLRLQELASMDVLTKTFNRRSLFEHLETLWNEFTDTGRALNCIMLDVDHFKKLNDNFGHSVGDQVLRDVSSTIKESIVAPAFVGRYGGEEFCVVIPDKTAEEAAEVGETIRYAIESGLAQPYAVTASFGVSSCEFGASTFQLMLEQADQALYAAKHGGRNRVALWSEKLNEVTEEKVDAPKISCDADQPISYHAVASLHAALAYRDADTALHSQRVAEMSVTLARGLMPVSQLYTLEIAAILHDIGKIGVPDSILLKPGKLDVDEWKIMEAHARMGVEIVESSFVSKDLSDIVRYHHYRYDGTNTPEGGPVGKDIPLGARIVCIVDAFDAMVSNRVYRKGREAEEAFNELRRCAGSQFDPDLVDRFVKMQIGWRPDSRHMQSDLADRFAITIGHLTERTMAAFEARDTAVLCDSLKRLSEIAKQEDMPAIANLAAELHKGVAEARDTDWEFAIPLLQDLLDVCLTVQRAHIRDVASRPQVTENCPQSDYYAKAREWDTEMLDVP